MPKPVVRVTAKRTVLRVNHYRHGYSHHRDSRDNQDIALGMRFLVQLLHGGHVAESNLPVAAAWIQQSESGT